MKIPGKQGRHGPAFVLMQVAKSPGYGLDILNRLKDEMPTCPLDTAAIYRALQLLEEAGAVQSKWDTAEPGPAKRRYQITGKGYKLLDAFRQDVAMRLHNLTYFLNELKKLDSRD